jgi:peptidoglycan/LPS O-acetylase OafA/YrhL
LVQPCFFWTLAIEFQFYALIGLLLPLILTKKYNIALLISVIILIIGHNRPDYLDWFGWFFGHASFFFLGILLFLKKEKILSGIPFIALTLLTITICYYQNSIPKFMFGIFAFCIILFEINISFKLATYIGGISYSLYIIHWPFGILIESIMKRIIPLHEYPLGKIVMLIFYTIASVLFAHFFNKLIEKRFLILSKKLK